MVLVIIINSRGRACLAVGVGRKRAQPHLEWTRMEGSAVTWGTEAHCRGASTHHSPNPWGTRLEGVACSRWGPGLARCALSSSTVKCALKSRPDRSEAGGQVPRNDEYSLHAQMSPAISQIKIENAFITSPGADRDGPQCPLPRPVSHTGKGKPGSGQAENCLSFIYANAPILYMGRLRPWGRGQGKWTYPRSKDESWSQDSNPCSLTPRRGSLLAKGSWSYLEGL